MANIKRYRLAFFRCPAQTKKRKRNAYARTPSSSVNGILLEKPSIRLTWTAISRSRRIPYNLRQFPVLIVAHRTEKHLKHISRPNTLFARSNAHRIVHYRFDYDRVAVGANQHLRRILRSRHATAIADEFAEIVEPLPRRQRLDRRDRICLALALASQRRKTVLRLLEFDVVEIDAIADLEPHRRIARRSPQQKRHRRTLCALWSNKRSFVQRPCLLHGDMLDVGLYAPRSFAPYIIFPNLDIYRRFGNFTSHFERKIVATSGLHGNTGLDSVAANPRIRRKDYGLVGGVRVRTHNLEPAAVVPGVFLLKQARLAAVANHQPCKIILGTGEISRRKEILRMGAYHRSCGNGNSNNKFSMHISLLEKQVVTG